MLLRTSPFGDFSDLIALVELEMGRWLASLDFDERLKRLSDLGDHLEAFASVVDFEMLYQPPAFVDDVLVVIIDG